MRNTNPAIAFITTASLLLSLGTAESALISYWNFDTNFDATVGGDEFNLTPNGGNGGPSITETSAVFGKSAAFDRSSSQYLFSSGDVVAAGSDFSYSAWYYLDVSDIGSERYFVMETTAGDSPSGTQSHPISLGLRDEGQGDIGQVFISSGNQSLGDLGNYKYDTTPNQTWHNLVTTYDASSKRVELYLDGQSIGGFTNTIGQMDPGNGIVIGGHRDATGRNWEGYIDDVAIWDEVISSSEITRIQSEAVAVPEPAAYGLLAALAAMTVTLRRPLRED